MVSNSKLVCQIYTTPPGWLSKKMLRIVVLCNVGINKRERKTHWGSVEWILCSVLEWDAISFHFEYCFDKLAAVDLEVRMECPYESRHALYFFPQKTDFFFFKNGLLTIFIVIEGIYLAFQDTFAGFNLTS